MRGAKSNYFCVGPFVQVCRKTGGDARQDYARRGTSILVRLQLPNSGPGRPRPSRSEQIGPYNARNRPFVNVANSLTSPRSPARGRTQTNPLMAGRRRRTPAAALRWRRCRCRCRSSNRSTCAGIECHSSPPRSTRRRPAPPCPPLFDGVEVHDGTNAQDR